MLSDRFQLILGGFWPDKSLALSVNGSDPNEEIDFDESLRREDDELTFNGSFRWRFGEKWSLWAQYWEITDKGGYVLDEDVEWEDLVFKQGSFAETGLDMSVARLFFGRVFHSRPNQEFQLIRNGITGASQCSAIQFLKARGGILLFSH